MINWQPDSIDEYRDIQSIWRYHNVGQNKSPEKRLQELWRSSRDNARTPVQWSGEKNGGFTTADTPWMSLNPTYTWINVESQEKKDTSILNFYRKAIALRKKLHCVRHGRYQEHFRHSDKIYMYSMESEKEKILVVCSFHDQALTFRFPKGFDPETGRLVLCNYETAVRGRLKPYECKVYHWNV